MASIWQVILGFLNPERTFFEKCGGMADAEIQLKDRFYDAGYVVLKHDR